MMYLLRALRSDGLYGQLEVDDVLRHARHAGPERSDNFRLVHKRFIHARLQQVRNLINCFSYRGNCFLIASQTLASIQKNYP